MYKIVSLKPQIYNVCIGRALSSYYYKTATLSVANATISMLCAVQISEHFVICQ